MLKLKAICNKLVDIMKRCFLGLSPDFRHRIFCCSEKSFDKVDYAGVILQYVGCIEGMECFHTGILYMDGSSPKVLHLAGANLALFGGQSSLQNSDPEVKQIWAAPNFPSERLQQVAAHCRRLWRIHGKNGLDYAFSSPEKAFLPSGQFNHAEKVGLTCASFVISVFHDLAGMKLLDLQSWKIRDDDENYQKFWVKLYEKNNFPQVFVEKVRKEVGNLRYRPAEVVAGAAISPPFALFDHAVYASVEVEQKAMQVAVS